MPLTRTGAKVRRSMAQTYGGAKHGDRVFYASINARKPGSAKWHRGRAPKRGRR